MNKPVIVLGAGGHASVLVDMLRSQGVVPLALVAPAAGVARAVLADIPLWHDEAKILAHRPDEVELINGIGFLPGNALRTDLYARYRALDYRFAKVVSQKAIISDYTTLKDGIQIMAGVIIQPGCEIGENTIINTRASIDHDCRIGGNVHVAPGATLCGSVMVEDGAFIGAGATVTPGVRIGGRAVVGAGVTLVRNLPPAARVIGAANRLR